MCHVTGDLRHPPRPLQLFEILAKTPYGHERKNLLGIHQLLAEGVFSAAFPLHDVSSGLGAPAWAWEASRPQGPFKAPPEGPQAPRLNQRQVLFRHWARWGKWSKYQPLDHVRRYFGEKVALYFAWLGESLAAPRPPGLPQLTLVSGCNGLPVRAPGVQCARELGWRAQLWAWPR
ncbi:Anoctamin-7 [Saguinus oedipus]|uniref:Anoctamin-7 n=1 Tax=Saguinus oedipus TaxID=9490 RepID=A0ABQ9VGP5_SAGOE|nr:Anoctamin-7 [Saguinus oedipus]